MQEKALVTMRNINKAFPGVHALQDVDFTLRKGEIHALMGENGAGKSTLIKVLTGVYPRDSGQIFIDGIDKAVNIKSPQEAQELGISPVYQEITLCPNLTVAENMFIGRGKYSFVNWGKMRKKAKAILDNLGIPARPAQQLANCSLAVQQMVAIARAIDMDCKALILDEPTSSLDDHEVAKLFSLMRGLKERGVGIVFVTHFLEQVYEVCNKITVLRNGELVGEYDINNLPRVELVSKMMGKELGDLSKIDHRETVIVESEPVYEADGLSSAAGVKAL
jgi:simple sugar transport system ATP-binding protein